MIFTRPFVRTVAREQEVGEQPLSGRLWRASTSGCRSQDPSPNALAQVRPGVWPIDRCPVCRGAEGAFPLSAADYAILRRFFSCLVLGRCSCSNTCVHVVEEVTRLCTVRALIILPSAERLQAPHEQLTSPLGQQSPTRLRVSGFRAGPGNVASFRVLAEF